MLESGGRIFLCGSTAMGSGALAVLNEVLAESELTVDGLRKQGRLIQEAIARETLGCSRNPKRHTH